MMQPQATSAIDLALTCPRCGAAASPNASFTPCPKCGREHALMLGRAADPSVVLPPYMNEPSVRVKSSGVFVMSQGEVAAGGVSTGMLDPITGYIPMDQSGVAWGDIRSITIWRAIDVIGLVAGIFFAFPILLCVFIAIASRSGVPLIGAAIFVIPDAVVFYRALVTRAHWARIVGTTRTISIRFDRPGSRRRAFYIELMRRAGISAAPPIA